MTQLRHILAANYNKQMNAYGPPRQYIVTAREETEMISSWALGFSNATSSSRRCLCCVCMMFSSRSVVCLLFYNSLANHETGKGKLSLQCNVEWEEFICDIIGTSGEITKLHHNISYWLWL